MDIDVKDLIQRVMGKQGTLSAYIPNYEERESQIKGVNSIVESLMKGQNFIFEGPTGFGKSPTYLTSAMIHNMLAKESGLSRADIAGSGIGRCVVVTNGITLQEQLYFKDIPALSKAIYDATGHRTTYTYLKGRANFLCQRKYNLILNGFNPTVAKDTVGATKLVDWASGTQTGDRSELDFVPDYNMWKHFACTDNNECEGRKCPFYESDCFYKKRKEEAKWADIVVTNYHILFSDLTLPPNEDGSRKLLGFYDLIIFDEAHEVPKIARDFLERKVSYHTFLNMRRKLTALTKKVGDYYKPEICKMDDMLGVAMTYFTSLANQYRMTDKNPITIIPKGMDIPHEEFVEYLKTWRNNILSCRNRIYPIDPGDFDDPSELTDNDKEVISTLDWMDKNCFKIISTIKGICTQEEFEEKTYWMEKGDDISPISLNEKPIKVDKFLRENIFGNKRLTSIITSATLSVNGKFDYIRDEMGIDDAEEMIAPSPFNMKEQQLWYLPADALDGNTNFKDFNDVMIKNLKEIVKVCRGGVLGLFTSVYNTNLAAKEIRRTFPEYAVYKQGDLPRNLLLQKFAEDPNSILLGTKSFFTGIDIKGHSLRCVVIDKFPFEAPNDPVMTALNRIHGYKAFFKYVIPNMVITLKQAVGRGVRDTSDKCVIVIMDNRMATAKYKLRIHNSFNYDKTATRNINDVKEFIDDYLKEEKSSGQQSIIDF